MNSFPPEIRFNLPWRDYQARVLDELQTHLDDDHLHVVAAPGSGKTVLGLEVVRRLNRPALVFAPTTAIRDQWLDRFVALFCPPGADHDQWISRSLRNPRLLTVSTYQGLHSIYAGAPEPEAESDDDPEEEDPAAPAETRPTPASSRKQFLADIRRAGVSTIVVDEAHHLRSEWWKCLIDLKTSIEGCVVVALTATPPLDVSPLEWQRYIDLCGPVDAEISVPELVRQDNLCPHQDYVSISAPLPEEKARLVEFRRQVASILKKLYKNPRFPEMLLAHPCVDRPDDHAEQVLAHPAFFTSVAVCLNHFAGRAPRRLLRILGAHRLPRLDLEWMETLLTGCLYTHRKVFDTDAGLCEELAADLKRIGAVERRQVLLRNTPAVTGLLVSSLSKLRGIAEIVRLESTALAADLRLVILTDFIRRADLPRNADDIKPLARIGVIPIFETIRRDLPDGVRLGILSGSIVVIPRDSAPLMRQIADEMKIDQRNLRCMPMPHDSAFFTVDASGQDRQQIVRLITRLFNAGGITVLVGTKSLLGEGWDAPSINALILASFVGSYMLSNQMRGRAIRTQQGNPDKTANIWHLVCTEPGRPDPGEDLLMLTRRFKSFLGVSFSQPVIENGIERLDIGSAPFTAERLRQIADRMTARALDRPDLRRRWREALDSEDMTVVEQVSASPDALPRRNIRRDALAALIIQALAWTLAAVCFLLQLLPPLRQTGPRIVLLALTAISLVLALASLPASLRAFWLFIRHASARSAFKRVAKALLRSCLDAGLIQTPPKNLRIRTARLDNGQVSCSLAGAPMHEESLFLDALQELLGPLRDPRYMLVSLSPLGRFMAASSHAVPAALGRKRQSAENFLQMWRKYVGPARLVYTRTGEGRQALLHARAAAAADQTPKNADRLKSWQ